MSETPYAMLADLDAAGRASAYLTVRRADGTIMDRQPIAALGWERAMHHAEMVRDDLNAGIPYGVE